jgi:hypothetical protein
MKGGTCFLDEGMKTKFADEIFNKKFKNYTDTEIKKAAKYIYRFKDCSLYSEYTLDALGYCSAENDENVYFKNFLKKYFGDVDPGETYKTKLLFFIILVSFCSSCP